MSAIARIDWKRIARESADELARLQRELAEAREAIARLLDAADDSDGCQYGTLSTEFVRQVCLAATAPGAKEGER